MISPKRKLIILVQSLEQPRVIKRIISQSRQYDQIIVYAFRRKIYKVNNFSLLNEINNINYKIIGTFDNGSKMHRTFLFIKLFFLVFFNHGLKKEEIYSFGLDLRAICYFIPNKTIYYEISDIMWLYKSNYLKFILSHIDFLLCKKSDKVIFTSKGFYERYYSFLGGEKVKIIENKLKTYNRVKPIQNILTDKIRIAYIGAFRYANIINYLIEICKKNKNRYILNFYGDGPKFIISKIEQLVNIHENINYSGTFKNPDDLEYIYSQNNLNFVAYDNSSGNEKVAMPNKYYESGYFNIPIICSEHTYVGKQVEEMEMGWSITPTIDGINKFLSDISIKEILQCHNKIKNIDKSNFEEK